MTYKIHCPFPERVRCNFGAAFLLYGQEYAGRAAKPFWLAAGLGLEASALACTGARALKRHRVLR